MKTESEIKDFLKQNIAKLLKIDASQLQEDVPLNSHYGLDSLSYLTIGAMLEDQMDLDLNAEFFLKHTTIQELAENVARLSREH